MSGPRPLAGVARTALGVARMRRPPSRNYVQHDRLVPYPRQLVQRSPSAASDTSKPSRRRERASDPAHRLVIVDHQDTHAVIVIHRP
jgi:hypothetical protein